MINNGTDDIDKDGNFRVKNATKSSTSVQYERNRNELRSNNISNKDYSNSKYKVKNSNKLQIGGKINIFRNDLTEDNIASQSRAKLSIYTTGTSTFPNFHTSEKTDTGGDVKTAMNSPAISLDRKKCSEQLIFISGAGAPDEKIQEIRYDSSKIKDSFRDKFKNKSAKDAKPKYSQRIREDSINNFKITIGSLNDSKEKKKELPFITSESNAKQKITLKDIELQSNYLKNFSKFNIASLDDNEIYFKLGNSKVNLRMSKMNEYESKRKQENLIMKESKSYRYQYNDDHHKHQHQNLHQFQYTDHLHQQTDHQKYLDQQTYFENLKLIKDSMDNPSLGADYLRKKFHNYFKENKIQAYDNKFRKNYKQKSMGSLLLATRKAKDENFEKYEKYQNNPYSKNTKQKMKWKIINSILENKQLVIKRLMEYFENKLKHNLKESEKVMNLIEFANLMKENGITNDMDLINKLFWVFDEDGDKTLNIKEIAFGIEMFTDSTIDKKLRALFDMCDVDNSGTISKKEFINLMKKNLINNDHKTDIKYIVDRIFATVELDKKGEIIFENFKDGFEKNKEIQDIICSNIGNLKVIDKLIDNEIKNKLISFNPDLNYQLRMEILGTKISTLPLREEKFDQLMKGFIENKNKYNHMKKYFTEDEHSQIDSDLEE